MTLATEIASTTRKLSLLVGLSPFGFTSAGGNVLGVRVSKSFDSPVPVATITVDAIHSSDLPRALSTAEATYRP